MTSGLILFIPTKILLRYVLLRQFGQSQSTSFAGGISGRLFADDWPRPSCQPPLMMLLEPMRSSLLSTLNSYHQADLTRVKTKLLSLLVLAHKPETQQMTQQLTQQLYQLLQGQTLSLLSFLSPQLSKLPTLPCQKMPTPLLKNSPPPQMSSALPNFAIGLQNWLNSTSVCTHRSLESVLQQLQGFVRQVCGKCTAFVRKMAYDHYGHTCGRIGTGLGDGGYGLGRHAERFLDSRPPCSVNHSKYSFTLHKIITNMFIYKLASY